MAMISVDAKVWWEGDYWLIQSKDLDALTQGEDFDDAIHMLHDWVCSKLDISVTSFCKELYRDENDTVYLDYQFEFHPKLVDHILRIK